MSAVATLTTTTVSLEEMTTIINSARSANNLKPFTANTVADIIASAHVQLMDSPASSEGHYTRAELESVVAFHNETDTSTVNELDVELTLDAGFKYGWLSR